MKEEVKARLVRHVRFLEQELGDFPSFRDLTWESYRSDSRERRNVERWIENLVNSSIDISKLILKAEGMDLPETYREIVSSLSSVEGFEREHIEKMAGWVRLRNIVVHEYLDIRWASIRRFILEAEPVYRDFLEGVKMYLRRNLGRC
ncbi:MAG: hypothetical protein DRP95_06220 [Candidatus Latescibacterota bacterium]|nr:MAG: hypothetical protein DRP95_06220 [Candidatus Latescibacterota bacterium]